MHFWFLAVVTGFVLALPLTAWSRSLARRFGQLDRPGGHKRHGSPVPVAGGVAVFWAVALPILAMAVVRPELGTGRWPEFGTLLAGALGLHVVGLIDDRQGLGPRAKLGLQALAAAPLVTLFDVRLLPTWLGPLWSSALTVLWFLTIVNAFNFLDGLDGLLAGVGSISTALLGLTAVSTGQLPTAALLGLLLGALLGFFIFNRPPASIFMGDCGSLVVGYLIAYGSVTITYNRSDPASEPPWYSVLTPLVVLAIPLYDLFTVIGLRLARRQNPMAADRRHFPHRLVQRGMSGSKALLVICGCTLATGMGGVMLLHLEDWQAALVAVQTLTVLLVLALVEGTFDKLATNGT